MLSREELLEMIDHCLYYSGESYSVVFYEKYIRIAEKSPLAKREKIVARRVITRIVNDAREHLETLRELKKAVESDERQVY